MLPFLKPKAIGSVIIASRKNSTSSIEPQGEEGQPSPEAVAHAESILSAIANKDAVALAKLLEVEETHE